MTQNARSADATASAAAVSYVIDPTRCAELGRSLEGMLATRRCPKCQEDMKGHPEEQDLERQIQGIVDCCSKTEDYLRAEMPLMEIAFRVILMRGNQPVPLAELHDIVAEQWATPASPKNITVEGFRRILRNDRYYCIREVEATGG